MEELLIKSDPIDLEKEKINKAVKSWGSEGRDPYIRSNIFSKIFFHWGYRIIKLANIITLKNEYLGKLEGKNKSENYIQTMYDVWERKGYKNRKSSALLCTVLRTNFWNILLMIILNVITATLEFAGVYLFKMYISMFSDKFVPHPYFEDLTRTHIGMIFVGLKLISIFFNRQASLFQNLVGNKSGIELNCLIYNKVLKASPASIQEKSKEGEIITFMQVDSVKLTMMMASCPILFTIPLQIIVYTFMLFQFMGISFIFGFVTLVLFLLMNFYIQSKYRILQREGLSKKDTRMKVTTETFNSLKVLKLYAWEEEFLNRIEKSRLDELNVFRRVLNYSIISMTLLWFAPVAVSVASIGAYFHYNSVLKIEDIFTCLTIFNTIQEPIRNLPWTISVILETVVSLKRIENFMKQADIDVSRMQTNDEETINRGVSIKIANGNFSWGLEVDKQKDKEDAKLREIEKTNESKEIEMGKKDKRISIKVDQEPLMAKVPRCILKNINFEIKQGEFVCVIGDVGSGKSSLLQAILNNMLPLEIPEAPTGIIVNGKVSYVSQISWIQNDTVKNNIIFHSEFDQARYDYVLDICELKPDLQVLVGGDMTEIGEKGINISGGQKARISMARALYANSDIYLLDDPISALDAHVGEKIMRRCIEGHLKDKTRILVTHALQYLSNADRIFYLNQGEIKWEGTYKDLCRQDFFTEINTKLTTRKTSDNSLIKVDSVEEVIEEKPKEKVIERNITEVKKIIKEEDKEEGNVQMSVYYTYIRYMGGFCLFFVVIFVMITWQSLRGGSDLWLAFWTSHQDPENNFYYYLIYAGLGVFSALFVTIRMCILTSGTIRLGKRIHKEMITKLVHAPINLFHDTVPKGVILNRLSKDLTNVDIYMMFMYGSNLAFFFAFLSSIVICSVVLPYCLFFVPFLFLSGYFLSRFYINCSRDLSRLDGTMRSPIINLLAETIPGAITIRAFNYQNSYSSKFYDRADEYNKIRFLLTGTAQWFGLILDLLSISFIVFLIIFTIIYHDNFDAQSVGILLTYSMTLQSNLFQFLTVKSNLENCMVSLERCLKYTKVETELPYEKEEDKEIKNWPNLGTIKFINYSVKYRPDTELVLKNLNITINSGEKIGVVGRTGSGKSTLCLALFRILEPTIGSIEIDGVDISTLGLKKLRSNLTIIPQDPNLMQGTLRYNIDPLNLYDDEIIRDVIQMIGFSYIFENDPNGLDQIITENGGNLSVGEKQLICICRAILRKSKVIVMDEATASIDMRTEEIIQKAINEMLKSSTVITIAHRIKTILHYDRILVLSNGETLEFDSPDELLKNKSGLFYELHKKSNKF